MNKTVSIETNKAIACAAEEIHRKQIRAEFLNRHASQEAPYRIRALAVALTDPELSDGAVRLFALRLLHNHYLTGKPYHNANDDELGLLMGSGVRTVERLDAQLRKSKYETSKQRQRPQSALVTMIPPDVVDRIVSELIGIDPLKISDPTKMTGLKLSDPTKMTGDITVNRRKNCLEVTGKERERDKKDKRGSGIRASNVVNFRKPPAAAEAVL